MPKENSLASAYMQWLSSHEPIPPHMYQTHGGQVAVANGLIINHAFEAHSSHWIVRATGEKAPNMMVTADFSRVRRAHRAHDPDWYERVTLLRLSDESYTGLFDESVNGAVAKLLAPYPAFHSFPRTAQIALVDLCLYGADSTAAKSQGSPLRDSIVKGDWESVSHHCRRFSLDDDRNNATSRLFLRAMGEVEAKAKKERKGNVPNPPVPTC
jgi:hypothetical protein